MKSEKLRKQYLESEKKYCSYGDTVHYSENPPIFTNADGSYMYDMQDNKYFDLQMWYSAVNLGYKNPQISKALISQIETLPQIASQYLHPTKIQLAEKICKMNEKRFGVKGRVHFNVGGAQAVEDALKLIRVNTQSNNVFAFMGGYHGRTIGASSITSSYRYRKRFGHFGDRAFFVEYPYTFRCPDKNVKDYTKYFIDRFRRLFESEYYSIADPKDKTCEYKAFFIEPIQGTGGYIIPPKNYFIELKKVLDKYGILLVVDEIQMGFYRTGKLWSIEHFGVTPDIIIFGKALTNGLNPLSGIWAKEELISPDKFGPGSTHSTFASNPLGTSLGLATLEYFEQWNNVEKDIENKGKYFLSKLKSLQKKYPSIIGDVGGLGLALRMELCENDKFTPSRKRADFLFNEGLKADISHDSEKLGLILDIGGYYKNIITLAPSLLITRKEIDLACSLIEKLIQRIDF